MQNCDSTELAEVKMKIEEASGTPGEGAGQIIPADE